MAHLAGTSWVVNDDGSTSPVLKVVPEGEGGGTFLISETARVDPSGNDSTGVVGDILKPFLTVQAALEAHVTAESTKPVILFGVVDYFEDLTTSLTQIFFIGIAELTSPFNSLTFTQSTGDRPYVQLENCYVYGDISAAHPGRLTVEVHNSFAGNISNSAGPIGVFCPLGVGAVQGTISCPGFAITLKDLVGSQNQITINSVASAVTATNSRIQTVTASGALTLIDSRVTGANNANSTIYQDIMLANLRPSILILPTSDPLVVGALWNNAGTITISNG